MKATIFLLVIIAVISILSGCNSYRWWRDDYMGRTILEPKLAHERVERDPYGNPILPKGTNPSLSAKKVSRHD